MQIRLNKYLSDSGICSRRKADEHILAGNVMVNDSPATLGQLINPHKDEIKFFDTLVTQKDELVYYALNKPIGAITTSSDEQNRKTVIDLVPTSPRVYPVGRLDKDSQGLLLLTNDGDLTHKLTHPSFEHEKEYEVTVISKDPSLTPEIIRDKFLKGLFIDQHLMKAEVLKTEKIDESKFLIRLILLTGYNRQIRKMCAKIGLKVIKLKRTRIAKLKLEKLGINLGEYKKISINDII